MRGLLVCVLWNQLKKSVTGPNLWCHACGDGISIGSFSSFSSFSSLLSFGFVDWFLICCLGVNLFAPFFQGTRQSLIMLFLYPWSTSLHKGMQDFVLRTDNSCIEEHFQCGKSFRMSLSWGLHPPNPRGVRGQRPLEKNINWFLIAPSHEAEDSEEEEEREKRK